MRANQLKKGMLVRGNLTPSPERELWEVKRAEAGLYLEPWFSCAAQPFVDSEQCKKGTFTELKMPATPRELISFIREFQNNYDERIQ